MTTPHDVDNELKAEQDDLASKMAKVMKYLADGAPGVSGYHVSLLRIQYSTMQAYQAALSARRADLASIAVAAVMLAAGLPAAAQSPPGSATYRRTPAVDSRSAAGISLANRVGYNADPNAAEGKAEGARVRAKLAGHASKLSNKEIERRARAAAKASGVDAQFREDYARGWVQGFIQEGSK